MDWTPRFGGAMALMLAIGSSISPTAAIYLSRSGDSATLVGSFNPGDDAVFASFLSEKSAPPLRVLYLSSHGGAINSALAIARMVRKAGLTTAVRADSAYCDSACTLVFAAGVRRHYIHGETVQEGYNSLSGLGYHAAHLKGDRAHFNIKSDAASGLMDRFYAEMGQPETASLTAKGSINAFYRPNGATALRMHIATSLGEP